TQPSNQGGGVLGTKVAEGAVRTNLGTLVALRTLAPLPLIVRVRRYTGLLGEIRNDGDSDVLPARWEAPLVLEDFQQHGKTEPGGAGLVPEQGALVRGERPVLGQFVRVPLRLHATLASGGSTLHGGPSPGGGMGRTLFTSTVAT